MFESKGYIEEVTNRNVVKIAVPIEKSYRIDKQEIYDCTVLFEDGRRLTHDQRKAIFACVADISAWSGHFEHEIYGIFKWEYAKQHDYKMISLSNCTMTEAAELLQLIIDFMLLHGVPIPTKADGTRVTLLERASDTGKYLYACLVHKRCCICGKTGELHHVNAIGKAYRKTTQHIGRDVMCLCRECHGQAHSLGVDAFNSRYNVFGIKCDKTIAKIYNFKK